VLANAEELARTNRELAATIAALEEAKRELTEMESRTRLTTEMMPAHIAHLDAGGRYVFTNRRLSSLMPRRRPTSSAAGSPMSWGPSFPKIEPALRRAYAGEAAVLEFTDDLSSRRHARRLHARRRGRRLHPHDGRDRGSAGPRRAAQARRRELAAQLTSGLAHDFSNLLTIILGMQSRLAAMDLGPRRAR
jgi:hypothetical protein